MEHIKSLWYKYSRVVQYYYYDLTNTMCTTKDIISYNHSIHWICCFDVASNSGFCSSLKVEVNSWYYMFMMFIEYKQGFSLTYTCSCFSSSSPNMVHGRNVCKLKSLNVYYSQVVLMTPTMYIEVGLANNGMM
jgi:hypothetical protein